MDPEKLENNKNSYTLLVISMQKVVESRARQDWLLLLLL